MGPYLCWMESENRLGGGGVDRGGSADPDVSL